MAPILNALTVDVEDYFQVSAFEHTVNRSDWDQFPCRVERNTRRIVDMLGRSQVRATFFVLGWVARRFPGLVREIHAAGHEIGSHSYWHRLVYRMTPHEFRDDLRMSREVLEDIVGQPVTAFRAPSFSITRRSLWALEILAEEGFHTDSSIFPVRHDRYGIPGAEWRIHRLDTPAGALTEFPPAVVRTIGVRLPVSGGGYFRLYPWAWTRRCLTHINHREGHPFVFYVHPWELDPQQPRLHASLVSQLRHYVNLDSTERKLECLLNTFRFGRLSDSLDNYARRESWRAKAVTTPVHETELLEPLRAED